MVQQEGEFLRKYMTHFNMAILEVKYFNESITMLVLKRELRSYCLIFFLNKNFLKNYGGMLARIWKYAHAKEEKKLSKKEKKNKEKKKQPHEEEHEN